MKTLSYLRHQLFPKRNQLTLEEELKLYAEEYQIDRITYKELWADGTLLVRLPVPIDNDAALRYETEQTAHEIVDCDIKHDPGIMFEYEDYRYTFFPVNSNEPFKVLLDIDQTEGPNWFIITENTSTHILVPIKYKHLGYLGRNIRRGLNNVATRTVSRGVI